MTSSSNTKTVKNETPTENITRLMAISKSLSGPTVIEYPEVYGLDVSSDFAATGQKYWKKSGVEDRIELLIGDAIESMDSLIGDSHIGTFDLIFIDADKSNYDIYYEKSLQLLKQNGVVAIDNTLWHGRLEKPEWQNDADTIALNKLNKKLHKDERVTISMLSMADGVTLCRKR